MNSAKQLIETGRLIDSLLRRLDVDFDEWADLMRDSVKLGKIPGVDELVTMQREDGKSLALTSAIKQELQRISAVAAAKAQKALDEAKAAEELARGDA